MRAMTSWMVAVLVCAPVAWAVDIEWVTVGDVGNAGELSGESVPGGYGPDRICGAVDYVYDIGKFEVTAGQYTEFLNAVAARDPYGLYDWRMSGLDEGCMIERVGPSGAYSYSVAPDWADRPVNRVGWGDAARFANWLHNGQPTGAQDLTTTEDGAYFLNGAMLDAELMAVTRRPDARVCLPSEDEWYKAAYYDASVGLYYDYPTGLDVPPTPEGPPGTDMAAGSANYDDVQGGPYYRTAVGAYDAMPSDSPYGTFDQGGNVWEWSETAVDASSRVVRGGSYSWDASPMNAAYRNYSVPIDAWGGRGFRVASVEAVCGDGMLQWWAETCDDGNTVAGDGCDENCYEEICGNGFVQPALGEECDDGNDVDDDGCSNDCEFTGEVCVNHLDCVEANDATGGCCEWDRCNPDTGTCDPPIPNMFGDVCGEDFLDPPNGAVNLSDVLCTLNAMGLGNQVNCPNADVVIVMEADCPGGNGVVGLTDILKVLDAFGAPNSPSASYFCDCPRNP